MIKETQNIRGDSLNFIDLFAGLGGFHLALKRLGHECVFASELDFELRNVYKKNFGIEAHGDIQKVSPQDVPKHEILTAGFPCQPLSKAGNQLGLRQQEYANLLQHVFDIIRYHHPRFIILENVPNLEKHDEGKTWGRIKKQLEEIGYEVQHAILSPHKFGIPQIRERMIIVAILGNLKEFKWPTSTSTEEPSIYNILEKDPPNAKPLNDRAVKCLEVWQQFIQQFPKNKDLPTFPIWTMEFGATYPFEDKTPFAIGSRRLRKYHGSHGIDLASLRPSNRFEGLPSYARTEEAKFPSWKKDFIRWNRLLYSDYKEWIDRWLPSILEFPSSLQKLEWNYKGGERDIWKHIIQFRPSGVRIKRPTTSPSLIAMNSTQVPVIGWERRYITPKECLHLQSMDELHFLPETQTAAFRALGNAVNVTIVELVARALLSLQDNDSLKHAKRETQSYATNKIATISL